MSICAHHTSQLALQLLDDACKATAGLVEEVPAPLHGLAVITGRWPFVLGRHVTLVVPEVVLQQDPELGRVCDEQGNPGNDTHDVYVKKDEKSGAGMDKNDGGYEAKSK